MKMAGQVNNIQIGLLGCALIISGCASSSVMDLDANTIQIATSAAPVCGSQGAQQVAIKRAAYETLRHGFDSYIILGAQAQNNVGVVGYTPITANTYSNGTISTYGSTGTYNGTSNTYVTGGQPIIAGTHDQGLAIHMFHTGEKGSENAIDAKRALGPDWQKILTKGPGVTC